MLVENRSELENFVPTWQGKPKAQVVEEIASVSLETKRIPDFYVYSITPSGELFSPGAGCKVKDATLTENLVGELELQAVNKTENWVRGNRGGAIVWISPPAEGFYTSSKVTVSQIGEQDGVEVLFNWAKILDIDEERCQKLARDLAEFSTNRPFLSSINQIRSTPIILNTRSNYWTYILEELIPDLNLEIIRSGEARKLKEEALLEARKIYEEIFIDTGWVDIEKMVREIFKRGMIGEHSSSCPNLHMFTERSQYFCKKCPICNTEINCVVRPGERCPSCQSLRECA